MRGDRETGDATAMTIQEPASPLTQPARKSLSCAEGTPGFNVTGEGRQFSAVRAGSGQVRSFESERKSLSCTRGSPGINATGEHRQSRVVGPRTSLWPALLGALHGTVLELGPGAGGNLRYYRPDIRWLGVEPSAVARDLTRAAAIALGRRAQVLPGRAEELELGDASVDAVVCSFVLCSVDGVADALAEVRRVLRPGGRVVFAEHVAAPVGTWVRRGQNLLAAWPRGCRPNRETGKAIADAGFTVVDLHRFDMPGPFGVGIPQLVGAAELTLEGHTP